ncbi:MAG: aldo/keto reductase [Oscillospiraceae bacterium]|nr:aldo/keto reductase [Oscillospiraceae bacterium]
MKNFGFGCMRLPMIGEEVDIEQFKKMTDRFMEEGFTYFDTAHPYIDGKSETAIREALVNRYPRESFVLADKLSSSFFNKEEEIRPLFEEELKACGVEYFDYFLMHAQGRYNYPKYCECRAYEIGEELKNEGKIKHLGLSFHDSAEYLDKILSEKPMVEFVQIQFNYADYDDDDVQARECLEVCRKHGKPVIVMEPVRGGALVDLNDECREILESTGKSCAEYAIRYAASFDGIFMVLSGMSTEQQLEENIAFMKDFRPLDEEEFAAVNKVAEIIKSIETIPCTACKYCTEVCPKNISVPGIINVMNQIKRFGKEHVWIGGFGEGSASNCIKCGKCEKACPQHIEIRKVLEEAAKEIE